MKKTVTIIGGGASALALAGFLDGTKYDVSIYEKNKALGRKFLVAGDGGFNLTHSEPMLDFTQRYSPTSFLQTALESFTNDHFRKWLEKIGISTFVGSSKRVYPENGIKPIEVLKKIEVLLKTKQVSIHLNEEWTGWNNDSLLFKSGKNISSDIIVFCLGGGSWKVTGSNDKWINLFTQKGINTTQFEASNCVFEVNWKKSFINKNAGKPLKNIRISCEGKSQKGEVVLTELGLEGNAVYALSPQIRKQLQSGSAVIEIDLKPMLTESEIFNRLNHSSYSKKTDSLKKELKLSSTQINLIKEYTTKEEFTSNHLLSKSIKSLIVTIHSVGILDEAISTVGGIALDELDSNFQLKKLPNHYCLGEMLDWDAPTGGYLLQACFSSGVFLAQKLNN